eukprot:1025336-Pelagomonas_calceolata.AAC.9
MLPQDMREANVAFARQQQQAHPGAASPQPPQPLSVEVRALPLCICALDRSSFVLPAKGAAATQARFVAQRSSGLQEKAIH